VKRKCELKQKIQKPTKHQIPKPVKSREFQINTQLPGKYRGCERESYGGGKRLVRQRLVIVVLQKRATVVVSYGRCAKESR
jgi:hypothetical protein